MKMNGKVLRGGSTALLCLLAAGFALAQDRSPSPMERHACIVAPAEGRPTALELTRPGEEGVGTGSTGGSRTEIFSINFLPDIWGGIFSSRVDRRIAINILGASSENLVGLEVGGLMNFESGSVIGFQAAGLANLVEQEVTGIQVAGLVNLGRGVSFLEAAGLANIATAGLKGGQIAGVANLALGDAAGMQIAGCVNVSGGDFAGVQLAGAANVATGSAKVQVGLVNVAGTVSGLQVGLVNVANKMEGLPIGLVSLESGGIRNIETWWDSNSTANLGLKFGTRRTYTLVEGGYEPASEPARWSYGLGLGGRLLLGGIPLDADLSWHTLVSGLKGWEESSPSANPQIELRILVGIPVAGLSLVAGGALDARMPWLSWDADGRRAASFELLRPRLLVGLRI